MAVGALERRSELGLKRLGSGESLPYLVGRGGQTFRGGLEVIGTLAAQFLQEGISVHSDLTAPHSDYQGKAQLVSDFLHANG